MENRPLSKARVDGDTSWRYIERDNIPSRKGIWGNTCLDCVRLRVYSLALQKIEKPFCKIMLVNTHRFVLFFLCVLL